MGLLAMFGKLFTDFFASFLSDQFSTPAENITIKKYEGKIRTPKSNVVKLAARYGLRGNGNNIGN